MSSNGNRKIYECRVLHDSLGDDSKLWVEGDGNGGYKVFTKCGGVVREVTLEEVNYAIDCTIESLNGLDRLKANFF